MNMKKVLCILVLSVVIDYEAISNDSNSIPISDFRPSWQIGQKWLVEISTLTQPRETPEDIKHFVPKPINYYFELLVEIMERIDDENCFQVRIDRTNAKGEKEGIDSWDYPFYRFFVRESSFTIKKVQRMRKLRGEIIMEWERSFPEGPVNAYGLSDFFPMAFPYFDPNALDYEPKVEEIDGGKLIKKPSDIISQKVNKSEIQIDSKKQEAVEITLFDKNDSQKKVTKQTWVKGMPWWAEAKIIKDGNDWCTARLIKVDGNDILIH